MSYCRWGWDNSDLYIFESASGCLECCACQLRNGSFTDVAEFMAHLDEHARAGEVVLDEVRPAIVKDWIGGRFADWDRTNPGDMAPYLHYAEQEVPETDFLEFFGRNLHMLGWDDTTFNEFKAIWEEKHEERREAPGGPAEERGPGD